MVEIPLRSDLPHFTVVAELDGTIYRLEFRWNTREAAYYMHMYDADEVLIQGALVRVDLRDKRTNLQALHEHALAALAPAPGARSRRVLVRRLRILGARASAPAPVPGQPRLTVPVRDLELRDLGGENGVTGSQLADLVARLLEPGLANALRSADLGRILGGGADKARSGWQKIKGVFH